MTDRPLPIIQSLWIGEKLSTMERLSIRSFLANGHRYHLYSYGAVGNVPEGASIRNAEDVLPADRIFVYKKEKSYAGFSNLFRYKLLLEHGGFWADTDVVCLKPFTFKQTFAINRSRPQNPKSNADWNYGSSLIGCEPGFEFIRRCYEFADQQDPSTLEWGQTGPRLTTRLVKELRLHDLTPPDRYFSCMRYWQWRRAIHPKPLRSFLIWQLFKLKGAYSLHFYNEMWRRNGMDKDATYPSHTVYERLKRKYGIGPV